MVKVGIRMTLEDFINQYLGQIFRGYSEYSFESKRGIREGVPIPDGFELLTGICLFPVYSIFVNKEKNALLSFDESDYSLSIYDSIVHLEAAIRMHERYFRESILGRCNGEF